ncbi:MAG: helix-turn-helix domain-containing protein [Oscillochloris sp.]|nr:helix-turn-helix domain-containing protein [Oscillochloris sp.]
MTMIAIPYDRQLVPGATLDDLNLDLVARTIKAAIDLGRDPGTHDPIAYLERYSGAAYDDTTYRPTVAGILTFGHEPDRWVPGSGIDIAAFATDQVLPTRSRIHQIRGPIFYVIDSAVALLREHCTLSRIEGARLINELDTPAIVLRELSTNAAVHRDLHEYGSQVRILVYPTVIEWSSPGGLPSNITIETLLTAQFSRNPTLAQFLFHAGYIERFGMGLDAVIDALRLVNLGDPEFYDDRHSFRVRVRRAVSFQPTAPNLRTSEGRAVAILDLFTRRQVWRQHEILENLDISRSTLQRALASLVAQGRLIAQGATKNRIYQLAPKAEQTAKS